MEKFLFHNILEQRITDKGEIIEQKFIRDKDTTYIAVDSNHKLIIEDGFYAFGIEDILSLIKHRDVAGILQVMPIPIFLEPNEFIEGSEVLKCKN